MRSSRLAVLPLLVLLCAPASALKTETLGMAVAAGGIQSLQVTSGQAMVRFSSGTPDALKDAALVAAGASRLKDFGGGWTLVGWSDASAVSQKLPLLKTLPGVEAADPSRVYSVNRTPNDPLLASQYALSQVRATDAWEFETGSSSRVTVAVIDTGIDGTHSDLSGKLTNTTSLSYNPGCAAAPCPPTVNNPPTPACNHATRVSGVAAASTDNGSGISGMSWGAQLLSLKVFLNGDCPSSDCSDASCLTNDPAVISAIDHAVTLHNTSAVGKVVINMSLGGPGACAPALQTAITNAVSAGVVVVAAAGNDGGAVNNPGNCDGVIPVAATDAGGGIASFSSRGPELAANGLAAPGVSVLTADMGGGTAYATGTSFSSPHVAGMAALILSAKPLSTPAQVKTILRASADNIGLGTASQSPLGQSAGAGRLNAFLAARLAIRGSLAGSAGEEKVIAFPNPFRSSRDTAVTFALPESLKGSDATIRIYTLDGQLVRELSSLTWNGKNDGGRLVASGTYVFSVATSSGKRTGRVSVIR